uniref:3-hydroxyisobutyrate dehydrogenase, mitochondrial n=1 Tax=Ascaris lumbricoides TaxID=6252 RepID=A0A0M3IG10_ASCLU
MPSVGFIGLGNMGSHMARNLMRNGIKLVVCDVDASRVAQLKAEGAEVAQRPADIAIACERIITMLPSSPHVSKVFTADDGILSMMKSGTLCVDSSTIDQSISLDIAKRVANKGGHFVDAPVSGGVVGAKNATLTFMVGGDETSFRQANEILKFMGKNVIHCGKVGSGQATKICNNMLLGIQMIGVAETMNLGIKLAVGKQQKFAIICYWVGSGQATKICNNMLLGIQMIGVAETMNLGIKMGLDAKQLTSIINMSSGRCWSSDTYNPVPGVIEGIPPSNAYIGGFGCTLIAKDLGLAQNASTAVQAPTPLGSLAHQLYRLLAKSPQYNKLDFGAIYQFLRDQ